MKQPETQQILALWFQLDPFNTFDLRNPTLGHSTHISSQHNFSPHIPVLVSLPPPKPPEVKSKSSSSSSSPFSTEMSTPTITNDSITFAKLLAPFKPLFSDQITQQFESIVAEAPAIHYTCFDNDFHQFHALTAPLQAHILSFLYNTSTHILSASGHSHSLQFDYILDLQRQPTSSTTNLQFPFSIMQFNMLADHLSGTHPQFGNFEGIDVKCLDMYSYRAWKLLYTLIEPHTILTPSDSTRQAGQSTQQLQYLNDVITTEEIDEKYYLHFFGPILAFIGYSSCFHAKRAVRHDTNTYINAITRDFGEIKQPLSMLQTPLHTIKPSDGTALFSRLPMFFPHPKQLLSSMGQTLVSALIQVPSSHPTSQPTSSSTDFRYVLLGATHLKATKSEEGEVARRIQIQAIYSHFNSILSTLLPLHYKLSDPASLPTSTPSNLFSTAEKTLTFPHTLPSFFNPTLKRFNLSVIITGDFNSAPYSSPITPYPPFVYHHILTTSLRPSPSSLKVMRLLNQTGKLASTDKSEPQTNDSSETDDKSPIFSMKSVYSAYADHYNSYSSYVTTEDNEKSALSTRFATIAPPVTPVHCEGAVVDAINYTGPEAPFTTMKTRGARLFKHTIDYILYNSSNNPSDSTCKLTIPDLVGIGTFPHDTQLPSFGLPDFCFVSDHLPLFALFDLSG